MPAKGYKSVARETMIGDLLDASDIQSLSEEMVEWRDNMEEHFSQTSKFEQVSECADMLENAASIIEPTIDSLRGALDEVDANLLLEKVKTTSTVSARKGRGLSRAVRLGDAVGDLRLAVDTIQERIEGWPEPKKHNVESHLDEIGSALDDLDGVDFPGMF